MSGTKLAPLSWAQRKDRLYLTFPIPDSSNVTIQQTATKLAFSCTGAEGQQFQLEFEFYSPVKETSGEWKNTGRGVEMKVMKKDDDTEYWPKLYKGSTKFRNITVDWNRWIDEDEEDQDAFDWGAGQELTGNADELMNQMQQQKLLEQLQEQVKNTQVEKVENDGLDDLDEDDEDEMPGLE
mmetsp:Transcript_9080/g.33505  ORF Transcript_9080/g.33505 Transcript_9080/m.33505 type:complete len:181 (-) Transcript_9080:100-642(-)